MAGERLPGAACDVPSAYYSLSYSPNPRWSRRYAPQREILDYLRDNADKYGLYERIRFGVTVREARFDDATHRWTVRFDDGDDQDVVAELGLPTWQVPVPEQPGAVVQVPLFVEQDTSVKVDTRTGQYLSRA